MSRPEGPFSDYRKLLVQFGMKASMSREGNRSDNAPMESFWGSLKNELVHHCSYATRAEADTPFNPLSCALSGLSEYTTLHRESPKDYALPSRTTARVFHFPLRYRR